MKATRLGNICSLHYGKGLRGYNGEQDETRLVRVFGTNGPIGWTSSPLYEEPTIVIGRKGAYRGVHFSPAPSWTIDTAYFLTLKSEVVDLKWLYYRLLLVDINRMDTGSAIPSTKREDFYCVGIRLPEHSQQIRIVDILSAYDDLIDNNRRRIQLLEEAARLLYKEWFVHLRFPGHDHVKITNGVPEGWELETVAGVCSSFEDGDWIETKDQGGEDFRLLQISNIGDNEFVETGNYRYISADTFRRLRCNEVVAGDILISRMPKPIGRAWYVHDQPWRMVTAVDVTIARPNSELLDPFYFLYHLNSPQHIARCEQRATGATRPRVTRKNIGALPILRPPMKLQQVFGRIAEDINRQRFLLVRASEKLAEARDLLLPRLMNGEIVA